MNDGRHLEAAADTLWKLRQDRARIAGLPAALRPRTVAEALAVQRMVESREDAPPTGWKIAATSAVGQAHINVSGPIPGRLGGSALIADGGECPVADGLMRVAEGEFAFRMGRDLAPEDAPHDRETVLAAVASLHPAIEIPDSRYDAFERAGALALIADSGCAYRYVLGPAAPAGWRGLDLAGHPLAARRNGELVAEGTGAAALGDPVRALCWLVGELTAHGVTLRKGDVVMTGTCIVPVDVKPGDTVGVDFGALGAVSVRMVE